MTLKELNEKLGAARKRKTQAVKNRASKLSELETLMTADTPDQEKIDAKQEEITALKADIQKEDGLIEMYTDQIADQSEVENYETPGNPGFHPGGGDGPTGEQKEAANYSLVKAFREAADPNTGLTGLEKEMNAQAVQDAKSNGKNIEGNLHVPQLVMEAPSRLNAPLSARQMGRIYNDLTVDGGAGGDQGGVTVDTQLRSLIDILKAKLVFTGEGGLGATFFNDLEGDVDFPKAVEDSNDPATKTEVAEADEQSPTFGLISLSPTRLPTFTEVTRKLLLQSSTTVEIWLRNYLMYKLKKKMEKDIITAILDHASINPVVMGDPDGGAPTWAKIVEFETLVADADADEPSMGWLTNPKVRGTLKTTLKADNTAKFLWGEDNRVNNAPAMISTLVPKDLTKGAGTDLSAAIFANWASLYIAQWGGLDFLVNPFSRDTEGIVRINAWAFFDSALRHPEAFAASQDIVTS